jgi:mRNA-degrading endonuclease RelE of RelBE toxin-antitoxin system
MRYSVRWKPNAEQQLAQIWLDATDRPVITKAAHEIDRRLQENPEDEGESRTGDNRVLFETPRAARFRVIPDDWRVDVLGVWRFQS